jgi:hypothetical protein
MPWLRLFHLFYRKPSDTMVDSVHEEEQSI